MSGNELNNDIVIQSEKDLISIIINSAKARFEIISKINHWDFREKKHADIFMAISKLSADGISISISTLADKLKEENLLESIGGVAYISEIVSGYYTDEDFESLLEIVYKNSVGRQLDKAIIEIQKMRADNFPIDKLFLETQQKILNIKTDFHNDSTEHIREILKVVLRNIEEAEKNGGALTGVPSGFREIDSMTNGWQGGDLIILAARPSMGKTAFALNLALNSAQHQKGVAFFSLEMPNEQLAMRMLSNLAMVDSSNLRMAKHLKDKWSKITSVATQMSEYNIFIDDTPGLNIFQIQTKLRKMKRDYDIKVCVIDYLQLIESIESRGDNRQNQISQISRQLKKIARELEIPIIALSQLSRSVEQRENKMPIMSDLRESGAIEQDADIIMFLYRDEYYAKSKDKDDEQTPSDQTIADVNFAKHRNGPIGNVKLNFHKNYGRFEDNN